MKQVIFVWCIIVGCQLSIVSRAFAQTTFTQRLQQSADGQGTVRIVQDGEIDALVNGKTALPAVVAQPQPVRVAVRPVPDTLSVQADTLSVTGRKVRTNGYRVQVYVGGNSRDAKRRAYQMEAQVHADFPEQPVYTRFVSPRWICHVGDFRTRDEALDLLHDMQRTGHFPEAITVRCKINAYIHE